MAHQSTPEMLALHGLRLVGTSTPERLAEQYAIDEAPLRAALGAAAGADHVEVRTGRFPGYRLTETGRDRAAVLAAEELAVADPDGALAGSYAAFGPLNRRLLDLCTRWQLVGEGPDATPNKHLDADYDAGVIDELLALHGEATSLLAVPVDVLDRFSCHPRRLGAAAEQIRAGNHDYVTKPMFPSYHSVWFELHEDFLATLGLERQPQR